MWTKNIIAKSFLTTETCYNWKEMDTALKIHFSNFISEKRYMYNMQVVGGTLVWRKNILQKVKQRCTFIHTHSKFKNVKKLPEGKWRSIEGYMCDYLTVLH